MTRTDKAQLTKLAQAMLEASGAAGICGPIPGTDNFIVIGNQEWIDRQASTAGAAKGGITSLEGLTRYGEEEFCATAFPEFGPKKDGDYFKVEDVERLFATTAASAVPADIKTWRERLPDDSGVLYNYAHVCAMKSEIADLRAALAAAPSAALSEKAESADVRDQALEDAAKACDDLHYKWRWDNEPDSDSGPRSCASAIRALKSATTKDQAASKGEQAAANKGDAA